MGGLLYGGGAKSRYATRDVLGNQPVAEVGPQDRIASVTVTDTLSTSEVVPSDETSATAGSRIKIKHIYFSYRTVSIDTGNVRSCRVTVTLGERILYDRFLSLVIGDVENYVWLFENAIMLAGETLRVTLTTVGIPFASDDAEIDVTAGVVGIIF